MNEFTWLILPSSNRSCGRRRNLLVCGAHAARARRRTACGAADSHRRITVALRGVSLSTARRRSHAGEAQREAAALRAKLEESGERQQRTIEALLERTKNELRETTATRASERVGELVAPIAEKLVQFDRYVRELEKTRSEDSGGLKEQIASLLSRAEKFELATSQLSTHTSTLVSASRDPRRADGGAKCSSATSSTPRACSTTAISTNNSPSW